MTKGKIKYIGLEAGSINPPTGGAKYPGLGEGVYKHKKLPKTDVMPTAEMPSVEIQETHHKLKEAEFPTANVETTVKHYRLGEYK